MFNIDNSTPQATNGTYLAANQIHKVKFLGAEATEVGKENLPVVRLKFEGLEGGTIEDTIFAPNSSERKLTKPNEPAGANNFLNPSSAEQFQVKLRQYIAALNPDMDKAINAGTKKIGANSWDDMRKLIIAVLENKGKSIGREVELKVLKRDKYAAIPGFIAGLSKKGDIYHRTKFIGEGLSFTDQELKTIEKQAAAKPDDMGSRSNDLDGETSDNLGSDDLDFLDDL